MERNSGVVTGAAPPPGTPGTSGPAGLRFRSQGWMKSTSLADPTGTALGGGLVRFFFQKTQHKKEQETKKYHVIILVQLGARDFHAQSRHGLRIVDYS